MKKNKAFELYKMLDMLEPCGSKGVCMGDVVSYGTEENHIQSLRTPLAMWVFEGGMDAIWMYSPVLMLFIGGFLKKLNDMAGSGKLFVKERRYEEGKGIKKTVSKDKGLLQVTRVEMQPGGFEYISPNEIYVELYVFYKKKEGGRMKTYVGEWVSFLGITDKDLQYMGASLCE